MAENNKKGKIITFLIKKGGAWKTSTLLNVAGVLVDKGAKVAIFDADTNEHCNYFAQRRIKYNQEIEQGNRKGAALEPFKVSIKKPDDNLLYDLDEARKDNDYVLVDTGGYENDAAVSAAQKSDIIYLPTQPSNFDIKELVTTLKVLAHLEKQGAMLRENPDFMFDMRILMTHAEHNNRTNRERAKTATKQLRKFAALSGIQIPNISKWPTEYVNSGLTCTDAKSPKRAIFEMLVDEIDGKRDVAVSRER